MRQRFAALRDADQVDAADLRSLWLDLDSVTPEEILGPWRGGDFAAGHPLSKVLTAINWHGKRFDAVDDAHPLICRGTDGELVSNTDAAGGRTASLWPVEVDGSVTATMVYDALPVFDSFRRIDDDTLMGLMQGKLESAFGITEPYWFWLERDR